MADLYSRSGAERLKKRVVEGGSERGQRLAGGLFHQFNDLHSKDFFPDAEIERLLLKQKEWDLKLIEDRNLSQLPKGLIHFSPSGASKCQRELWFKANKMKKDITLRFPFQRRWTRNSSAVHEAVQRDLLYCEKLLDDRVFEVERLESGLPAWEQNIKTYKRIEHNGVEFLLYGMCDGILKYLPDGSRVGFEFKTKSTTIGAVGTFKMKEPAQEHRNQCTAYSILFGVEEFILCYESVAKDGWTKGAEAKVDVRTFYIKITDADRKALLDRYSEIAKDFYENKMATAETDRCFFCEYKSACQEAGVVQC